MKGSLFASSTLLLGLMLRIDSISSFQLLSAARQPSNGRDGRLSRRPSFLSLSTQNDTTDKSNERSEPGEEEILGPLASSLQSDDKEDATTSAASVRTVNERLKAELREATDKEKFGAKSAAGKKFKLDAFQSPKSEEERQKAIEEARDLNGVNPVVAIMGSLVALAIALGMWMATTALGEFFALHPVESDVYFVTRAAIVFRNVAIGLVSLAAGFFGVTGFGILLLGIRVAYGVAQGELDPTPIARKKVEDDLQLPNVMDLMMNKRPSRRNRRKDDNNPFNI